MNSELYNKLVCAITHNLNVCEKCNKCNRLDLIKELSDEFNKELPFVEENTPSVVEYLPGKIEVKEMPILGITNNKQISGTEIVSYEKGVENKEKEDLFQKAEYSPCIDLNYTYFCSKCNRYEKCRSNNPSCMHSNVQYC